MTEEQMTSTEKRCSIYESLGPNPTIEKKIPDDVVWFDDAFYIFKTRFGMHTSVLKEPILGAHFITGMEEEGVINITRWHLKCLQEGTLHLYTRVVGSGIVGGKL